MKKITNEKEDQWIKEGVRLKQLREEHQMSRAELAQLMNTSATRLVRLENGEGVRDARILSQFYEHIIKHQDLVKELEALYFEWMVMEEYVMELSKNLKTSKINKEDLELTKGIQKQRNSEKTRSNQWILL